MTGASQPSKTQRLQTFILVMLVGGYRNIQVSSFDGIFVAAYLPQQDVLNPIFERTWTGQEQDQPKCLKNWEWDYTVGIVRLVAFGQFYDCEVCFYMVRKKSYGFVSGILYTTDISLK